MSFARSARTRVLPVPHIPDGLTIAPATEARQRSWDTEVIMPDKGKVERPYRYIRQDFFLGRSFRNLEDLDAQLAHWLETVANERVHATTRRVVAEAFAEERPHLKTLPLAPYRTVLKLERRITRDGMVSVGGNLYSVPDRTRRTRQDTPADGRGSMPGRGDPHPRRGAYRRRASGTGGPQSKTRRFRASTVGSRRRSPTDPGRRHDPSRARW